MSDFEDESFDYTAYEAKDDAPPAADARRVRFGGVELFLFAALWVLLGVVYWFVSRRQRRARRERVLAQRRRWLGCDLEESDEFREYQRLLSVPDAKKEELERALVRRTVAAVRRLVRVQQERASLVKLSRDGAFGDDMLGALKEAERELEIELAEVQAESETLRDGWGASIIRDAAQVMRIEDELQEMARRRERDEAKRGADSSAPAAPAAKAPAPAPAKTGAVGGAAKAPAPSGPARTSPPSSTKSSDEKPAAELSPEEKQRLLAELLAEQDDAAGAKARRRGTKA